MIYDECSAIFKWTHLAKAFDFTLPGNLKNLFNINSITRMCFCMCVSHVPFNLQSSEKKKFVNVGLIPQRKIGVNLYV